MKGKIILVPFPFTDLSASKLRPALILHEGDRDVVVAFISSKIPPQPTESDVIVTKNHPEFPYSILVTLYFTCGPIPSFLTNPRPSSFFR